MKKILFVLALGISLLIIIHLATTIYTLWHKQDVLTQAQSQLTQEEKENESLHTQLKEVSSPNFLDEQARDKLFMVKQGEQEVMIPQNLLPTPKAQKQATTSLPYYQQWMQAFFH